MSPVWRDLVGGQEIVYSLRRNQNLWHCIAKSDGPFPASAQCRHHRECRWHRRGRQCQVRRYHEDLPEDRRRQDSDVKFETFGCGSAIASSSMATELIKGKPLSQALELTNKAVAEALDGLPAYKMHCPFWRREAIKAAVKDYYDKHGIAYDESKFPDCSHCDHQKPEKILIAMSGGVDSSVAALLLSEAGCECVGATMRLFHNEDAGGIARKELLLARRRRGCAQRGLSARYAVLCVQFHRRLRRAGDGPLCGCL